MKMSINNNDLACLKYGKCEQCTLHYKYAGFCAFLQRMCFEDCKIFYETPYNSSIFNL